MTGPMPQDAINGVLLTLIFPIFIITRNSGWRRG